MWRGLFIRVGKFLGFRSRSLCLYTPIKIAKSIWKRGTETNGTGSCALKSLFFLFQTHFTDLEGSGKATAGVFQYFSWVLLQPFRGNPEYSDVADLPYDTTCLTKIQNEHTDMKSLSKFPSIFCAPLLLSDW